MTTFSQFQQRTKAFFSHHLFGLMSKHPVVIGPNAEPLVIGPNTPQAVNPSASGRVSLADGQSGQFIGPAETAVVGPGPKPKPFFDWRERGWVKQQDNGMEKYVGDYKVYLQRTGERLSYPGWVLVDDEKAVPWLDLEALPAEVKNSSVHERNCLFKSRAGPFFLHWDPSKEPARNATEAIRYLENLLTICMNGG